MNSDSNRQKKIVYLGINIIKYSLKTTQYLLLGKIKEDLINEKIRRFNIVR